MDHPKKFKLKKFKVKKFLSWEKTMSRRIRHLVSDSKNISLRRFSHKKSKKCDGQEGRTQKRLLAYKMFKWSGGAYNYLLLHVQDTRGGGWWQCIAVLTSFTFTFTTHIFIFHIQRIEKQRNRKISPGKIKLVSP